MSSEKLFFVGLRLSCSSGEETEEHSKTFLPFCNSPTDTQEFEEGPVKVYFRLQG